MKKIHILIATCVAVTAYYFTFGKKALSTDQVRSRYENKVVLICGASSGIGEEVAYQMAEVGARIMIVARRESRLIKIKEEAIKRGSPHVEYMVYDFSDVKNSSKIIRKTINVFGRLDYLIANHASMITGQFLAFPHFQDPDFIENTFRINTFSIIELALKALPYLEETSGHIYVTSSMAGEYPFSTHHTIYCATKNALNGFFYSLQSELIFKRSKVGITIGALGFITTKELVQVLDELHSVHSLFKGSVEDIARKMILAYIERPRTITYPVASWAWRFTWLLNPYFHEIVHQIGFFGKDYEESIAKSIENAKKAKEIGYQDGFKLKIGA